MSTLVSDKLKLKLTHYYYNNNIEIINQFIEPFPNGFLYNPSHYIKNSLPWSTISKLQKLFNKKWFKYQKQRPQSWQYNNLNSNNWFICVWSINCALLTYLNDNIQILASRIWRPNAKSWFNKIDNFISQQQKNIDERMLALYQESNIRDLWIIFKSEFIKVSKKVFSDSSCN